MLALLPILVLLANSALGQETPTTKPSAGQPLSPPPLAGLIVHGQPQAPGGEPIQIQAALTRLDSFESLDDGASIAALLGVMVEAASSPGTTVAILGIEGGVPVVAVATPGAREEDIELQGNVHAWSTESHTFFLYQRGDAPVDVTETGVAIDALATTFAAHGIEAEAGVEFMLDLENFRRAWPDALVDGPARRVVALTGLANARKIRVHVPESGAVRLSYSSRAQTADKVTTRVGPDPADETMIGVRWPSVFDAGLRMYAFALGDEARQAFTERFQAWMGSNGNRLRGLIQATEVAMDWSMTSNGQGGPGLSVTIPIRDGVNGQALADAASATLRDSGFAVQGNRATLELPASLAAAVGAQTLVIEVDTESTPMAYKISVE